MPLELSAVEARVFGALIEKEMSTPEYYPMTANALVAACNQKSNRDPVMALDEPAVAAALEELRYRERLAATVSQAGSRVTKYRHLGVETMLLEPLERALLCELLLRGPETVAELRTRVKRLGMEATPEAVATTLDGLGGRSGGPLVMPLPRETGRREPRWVHLLCGAPAIPEGAPADAATPGDAPAAPGKSPLQRQVDALTDTVADLTRSLAALSEAFDRFRNEFK